MSGSAIRDGGRPSRPARTSSTIVTGSSSMTRRAPSVRVTRTPRAPKPTQAALPAAISASVAGRDPQRLGVDERGGQPEREREQAAVASARRTARPYSAGVAATASATTCSPEVS